MTERNPPIRREHSISREKFINVLRELGSPAAAEAERLADIPGRYGLDRGVALAFFVHESSAGKAGIARDYQTKNWGNLRRVQSLSRGYNINTRGGQFAKYVSWSAGLEDWCHLLTETYEKRWGLTRLGDILMKYAPKADRNDPEAYAAKVVQHIERWRAQEAAEPKPEPEPEPVESHEYQIGTSWLVEVTATAGLRVRLGRSASTPVVDALQYRERVRVEEEQSGWLRLVDGRGYVLKKWTRRV